MPRSKKQIYRSEVIADRYINPFTDFGFKKLFGEENENRRSYSDMQSPW